MDLDETLARFATHLGHLRDEDSLTERLCEVSRTMLDAAGSIVTVQNKEGERTVCATNELSNQLEKLQDEAGEGPAVDAMFSDDVVAGEFGSTTDTRWPSLRELVAATAFEGSLIAMPLEAEVDLAGTLTVHRQGRRHPDDETLGRFLGAAVGTALLQDSTFGARGHVFAEVFADQEVVAAASEIIVDQTRVRREDALVVLRAGAFARGIAIGDAAEAVVAGRLRVPRGA